MIILGTTLQAKFAEWTQAQEEIDTIKEGSDKASSSDEIDKLDKDDHYQRCDLELKKVYCE